MIILGIDPSINNVGIAQYDTETKKLRTKTFRPTREKETNLQHITSQILRELHMSFATPARLVMEYPNFQDSERGQIAAQKGYTLDLAFIVGVIAGYFRLPSSSVELPTPIQWKGNLPKEAVGERFQRRFGILQTAVSDHEFEAAMMIAWYLDKPKPNPS